MTLKEQLHDLIDKLPDDFTLEDVQYRLYVLEKMRRGLESYNRDGGVSHEEAKQHLAKWLIK